MDKLELNINSEHPEVVVRTGDALPVKENSVVDIRANIKAPGEYLSKCKGQFTGEECFVVASLSSAFIRLTIGKHSQNPDTISGSLTQSYFLGRLPINTENSYSPKELGKLFKKNKFLFADESEFKNLVGKLFRFQAKVTTIIEKTTEQSGSAKDMIEKQVSGEIPESFVIKTPIFEGMEEETIRVELYAEVTSESVRFMLESSELVSLTYKKTKEIFDQELAPFIEFCPVFIE